MNESAKPKIRGDLTAWLHLRPMDIVFRLAALAGIDTVLFWLPIWYWTTYQPSNDDRAGIVLVFAVMFCPTSWILGVMCYMQVWTRCREVEPRYRSVFTIGTTLLFAIIFSTFLAFVVFFVKLARTFTIPY